MPLRVLHVSQPVDAGVARCVSDLARDQVRRGWEVSVACPDGPLAGAAAASGATVLPWRARRSPGPSTGTEVARLARLMREQAPQLVHLHSSKAGLAGRLALRGRLPTVFQPHAWSFFALEGPMRRAAAGWERLAARWAETIVCVSEGERAVGEHAGIQASFRVIPNGIDLDAYPPVGETERRDARQRLGLDEAARVVVCVGRLSRQKGQDLLLDAWPQVRRQVEATLVLVGGGPDEDELRARAGDGVRFAGVSGEVRSWLVAADLVVAPSRWEGLSYVLLEALACGRRVVATDVPGVRETLGPSGSVIPTDDVPALVEALVGELSAPGADESGRTVIETRHDLRETTESMAALYAELLERRLSRQ